MTAPHDELRRLLAAATPGPWHDHVHEGGAWIVLVARGGPTGAPAPTGYTTATIASGEWNAADAAIIAAAVNALPGLLDECAALTAEVERLRLQVRILAADAEDAPDGEFPSLIEENNALTAERDALRAQAEAADGVAIRAQARATAAEADELETIAERDAREKQIERIHGHTGCEREWTNLHDLGECCIEQVATMAAMAERVTAAEAEAGRLREALAFYASAHCRCGLEYQAGTIARTALAAGPAVPTKGGG